MPLAEVNGIRLYYEVTGKGHPVVFVHGFGCGIRSWDPQVRALAGTYRVIAYDVRGHGLSDAPSEAAAYSQPTSVEDLRQLLAILKVRRTAVIGLSMGGNIALNFALAHPTLVSALVIADTGAGSDAHADWVAVTQAFAAALDAGGTEAFADMAMASPLFSPYCSQGPAAQRFIRSCLMTHRARGRPHGARGAREAPAHLRARAAAGQAARADAAHRRGRRRSVSQDPRLHGPHHSRRAVDRAARHRSSVQSRVAGCLQCLRA